MFISINIFRSRNQIHPISSTKWVIIALYKQTFGFLLFVINSVWNVFWFPKLKKMKDSAYY